MATPIKLKNSSVKDRQPNPTTDLQYGEVALNYNNESPALYTRGSDDSLIQLTGDGSDQTPTDLSVGTRDATTMIVESSTGADATLPAATTSLAGLLDADDKTKLDAYPDTPAATSTLQAVTDAGSTTTTNITTAAIQATGTVAAYTDGSVTGKTTPAFTTGNGAGASVRNAIFPDGSQAWGGTGTFADGTATIDGPTGNIETEGDITAAGPTSARQFYSTVTGDYAFRVNDRGGYYAQPNGDEALYVRNHADSDPVITLNGADGTITAAGRLSVTTKGTGDYNNYFKNEDAGGIRTSAVGFSNDGELRFFADAASGDTAKVVISSTSGDIDTDGSITAAGTVETPRVNLKSSGTSNMLVGYDGSTPTAIMSADGNMLLGNTSGGGNIALNGDDGTITAANTIAVGTNSSPLSDSSWGYQLNANANENGYAAYYDSTHSSSSAPYFLRCYVNGTDTIDVRTDGSATFENTVTGKTPSTSGATFAGYYSGGATDNLSFVVDANGNINVGSGGKVNITEDSSAACGAQVGSFVNGGNFISQYTSDASNQAEAFACYRGNTRNVSISSTGNITAAGGANFKGRCDFGDNSHTAHAAVAFNDSNGSSTIISNNLNAGSNAKVFEGRKAGAAPTSWITNEGAATFKGDVTVHRLKFEDGSVMDTAASGGGGAAAWGQITSAGAIQSSSNVASCSITASGIYTVTFNTPMSSDDYCITLGKWDDAAQVFRVKSQTASGFDVNCNQSSGAQANGNFTFAVFSN